MANEQTPAAAIATSNALDARELEWAVNTPELLSEHATINQGIIRTRFPPEPNGYEANKAHNCICYISFFMSDGAVTSSA